MADFSKIRKQIDKLRKATPEEQEKVLLKIIKKNEQYLLDLNRLQLFAGIDADGKQLMPYQSKDYAKMKGRKIPDLYLTGALHRRMFINTEKFPLEYDSNDWKSQMLKAKYGKIFGPTKENKELAAQTILDEDVGLYYAGLFQL